MASIGLLVTGWLIVLAAVAARLDTGASGIFRQKRIGRYGQLFTIYKIRSMRCDSTLATTNTAADDPRITPLGKLLRRAKIDELPQFWNVLVGEMSLVGPRPESPAYLERVRRDAPESLLVRPGITSPASLRYRDEEALLANATDPESLNDLVILSDKLRLNRHYAKHYTLAGDCLLILYTAFGLGERIKSINDLPKATVPKHAA